MLRGRLDERFGTAHLGGLNMDARETRAIRRVKILGCGSAYYVGQMGAALIEELARIPADAEAASEFRYRNPVIEPDTLYVAVSQSGETIDTLLAVQEIRRKGGRVIGLVNVVGSAIARECDGGIYLHAGPEVAVASTKALTNMFLGFALLALQLGRVRDLSIADGTPAGRRARAGCPRRSRRSSPARTSSPRSRQRLAEAREPVLRRPGARLPGGARGRAEVQGDQLPPRRGLPDLRAQARPARADRPRRCRPSRSCRDDELTDRNVGALHEIAARGGPLVVITHEGVDLGERRRACRIDVPRNERELDPILLTIPLQLLAYHAAQHLGHDIDKPRNLAKSVTVE